MFDNYKNKFIPVILTLGCIIFFCSSYHLIPESLELVTGYIYSKYKSVRYGTIYGYHFVDLKNAMTNKKVALYNSYDELMEGYAELKNYKPFIDNAVAKYNNTQNQKKFSNSSWEIDKQIKV